ncbi:MAG TPA: 2-succinyl-5-enolpyruvyl-6-hydroxy-3-cyclohexene-1-carboxylic-acid synthase [Myxococcota bacterium]|nr:2-succinyl-5-enolpyruvyl-6-hydroxy-3-cyclohexene-1-carboxylic-acid synthase [Myxococcota bacterium]
MTPEITARNFAHYWCAVMVQGLIDRKVDHFFVAPGSRSTPFVSALARNSQAKISLGIDERSVCYAALGFAKCAQRPSAVVVTSGTAVANLYPAVVESYLSEVPLLLITADRPYELRNSGANQTIWQANMFSNHVNQSFDLAPPSSIVSLNQSLAIFDQAVRYCVGARKGPVHVNLQFREPVANVPHEGEADWSDTAIKPSRVTTDLGLGFSHCAVDGLLDFLSSDRGLIVVGELMPTSVQDDILTLSSLTNWPIFTDITSNLRLCRHPNLLHYGELAFLHREFFTLLDVDRVLKFGARVVSKRFWSWVEASPRAQWLSLSESPERIDHVGHFSHVQVSSLKSVLTSINERCQEKGPSARINALTRFQNKIAHLVDQFLAVKQNNEAYFVTRVMAHIMEPATLFLSSGMPIRDMDQVARPSGVAVNVLANRGVSGIDGVISSAAGVAIADEKPVILLIGDVAFLHDTNGLMLLAITKAPVLIIVINNNGGGIFHFLPIAAEQDVVTPYLDTPHDVQIRALCQAHHVAHALVRDPEEYDDALRQFFTERKTMVVEVVIDRAVNVQLHKDFYRQIANLTV